MDNVPDDVSPPRPGTAAVVLNGAAGALLAKPDAVAEIEGLFRAAGLEPDIIAVDAGTLPERIKMALGRGADAVVVGGGDGTIACAAQVLAGTGVPLGVLPFGTMNLLAKDLLIPVEALEAALQIVAEGHVQEIDVAEVNGRVFLCASMLGLPVLVGRFREKQRGKASGVRLWSRLAMAVVRMMRHYVPHRFRVRADDVAEIWRAPSITITSNAVDQAGGRQLGRTQLDGGKLFVYVVSRMSVGHAVRLAVSWLRGQLRKEPTVRDFATSEITLSTRRRRVAVMNDGEIMLLRTPLRYAIRPRALRVFAPRPAPASRETETT